MKQIRIVIVFFLSLIWGICTAEEKADTVSERKLDEVTVTAEREVHEGGGKVKMYLTAVDRNFGTNALDAVSHMSRFTPRLNESGLRSRTNKDVLILINGVPSDGYDLRSYKGSDVRYVEYYEFAPAQYAMLTQGPVVNVVIKRPHEMLLTGSLSTNNAVMTGMGTNQLDLAYRDSLNQVKIGYLIDYRDVHNTSQTATYDYGTFGTQYNMNGRYSGTYNRIDASYQRYTGNRFFNVRLQVLPDAGTEHQSGSGRLYSGDMPSLSGSRDTWMRSNSTSYSADLYYHIRFGTKHLLAFNLINSYGRSYSGNSVWQSFAGLDGANDYDGSSELRNKVYTLVGQATYTLGSSFQVAARYKYSKMSQRAIDDRFTASSNDACLYGEYMFGDKEHRWSVMPKLGVYYRSQETFSGSSDRVYPHVSVYGYYMPPEIKGLTLQLYAMMFNSRNSLSDMTAGVSLRDQWFVTSGNPALKTSYFYYGQFIAGYNSPDGKWSVMLTDTPGYTHNPVVTLFGKTANLYVMYQGNIRESFRNVLEASVRYKVLPWLELAPYFELHTFRYTMPGSGRISDDYPRFGGSVTVSSGAVSASISANSRTRGYAGDIIKSGSAQYDATVIYKYRNCSFGASYNYVVHNERTEGISNVMHFKEISNWKPFNYLVRLSFTYYFSKGKARSHDNRLINSNETDTGLNRNTEVRQPGR